MSFIFIYTNLDKGNQKSKLFNSVVREKVGLRKRVVVYVLTRNDLRHSKKSPDVKRNLGS